MKRVSALLMAGALALTGCGGQEEGPAVPTADPVGSQSHSARATAVPSAPSEEEGSSPSPSGSRSYSSAPLPSDMPPVPDKPSPDKQAKPRNAVAIGKVDRASSRKVSSAFVRAWLSSDFRADGDRQDASRRASKLATKELATRLTGGDVNDPGPQWMALQAGQGFSKVSVKEVTDDIPSQSRSGATGTGHSWEVEVEFKGTKLPTETMVVHTLLTRDGDRWSVSDLFIG